MKRRAIVKPNSSFILKKVVCFVLLSCGATGVFAARLMETDIIKCGAAGLPNSCGSSVDAVDPLGEGFVNVTDTGGIGVLLKGASPSATYSVFVGNWASDGNWRSQFDGDASFCGNKAIGTITTDSLGNFAGWITTAGGTVFSFPQGTAIGQPNFAFNNSACVTQFTTGFRVP